MPVAITRTQTERFAFARLFIDMEAGKAQAYFSHVVDEARKEDIFFEATAEEYGALLMEVPPGGRPRGWDIADAIYRLALARGVISGEIEPDPVPPAPEEPAAESSATPEAPAAPAEGGQ